MDAGRATGWRAIARSGSGKMASSETAPLRCTKYKRKFYETGDYPPASSRPGDAGGGGGVDDGDRSQGQRRRSPRARAADLRRYPPKKRHLLSDDFAPPGGGGGGGGDSVGCHPSTASFLDALESRQSTQEICVALLSMAFWRPEAGQNITDCSRQMAATAGADDDGGSESNNASRGDRRRSADERSDENEALVIADGVRSGGGFVRPSDRSYRREFGREPASPPSDERKDAAVEARHVASSCPDVRADSVRTPSAADRPPEVGGRRSPPVYAELERCPPGGAGATSVVDDPIARTDEPGFCTTNSFADPETAAIRNVHPGAGVVRSPVAGAPVPEGAPSSFHVTSSSSRFLRSTTPAAPSPVRIQNPTRPADPVPHSPSSTTPTSGQTDVGKMFSLFPKPARGRQLYEIIELMARRHKENYFIGWTAEQILELAPDQRPNMFPVTASLKKEYISKSVVTENKKLAFSWYSEEDWGVEFRRKLRSCEFKTLSDVKRQASVLWRKYCPEYDETRAVRMRDSSGNVIMKRTRAKSGSEFQYRQNLRKAKVNTVVDQIWSKRGLIAELLAADHVTSVILEIKDERPEYRPPLDKVNQLADVIAYRLKKELLSVDGGKPT